MARRTDDFRGLTQPSRLRLLAEIQAAPGLLLRELAERTGLHENTVRDHLVVLEAEGLVTHRARHRGTRGRPPESYFPVRRADANPEAARRVEQATRHGDLLRRMNAGAAHAGLDDDALHQVDTLYEHLDDSGFEPELDEVALEIDLTPCPFLPIADGDQELVCRVHERLIDDTLSQVPGPVRLTLLEPRLTHELCRVHLGLATEASSESDAGAASES
jgi:predicted ArsR family transcriptional regulator